MRRANDPSSKLHQMNASLSSSDQRLELESASQLCQQNEEPVRWVELTQVTGQLAPGHEPLEIQYEIHNLKSQQVLLEIVSKASGGTVYSRGLTEEEKGDGGHALRWDAKDTQGEYIGPYDSPYEVRLTASSGENRGKPLPFEVRYSQLELHVGKNPFLKALPAEQETQVVELEGNVFVSDDDKDMNDDTGFERYRERWKDEPVIPVYAEVKILDSGNRPVRLKGPLGPARILWDWKGSSAMDGIEGPSKAYVEAALDYEVEAPGARGASSKPRGSTNCHAIHGGKRGDPEGSPVFTSLGPFSSASCSQRRWALFSGGGGTEELLGNSGVQFRPGRIAGDTYELRAHLVHPTRDSKPPEAWDTHKFTPDELRQATQEAGLLVASTGKILLRRVVHLSGYIKKTQDIADIQFDEVAALYQPAQIVLRKAPGFNVELLPDYHAWVLDAIGELEKETALASLEKEDVPGSTLMKQLLRLAINTDVNQYQGEGGTSDKPKPYALTFRTHKGLKEIVRTQLDGYFNWYEAPLGCVSVQDVNAPSYMVRALYAYTPASPEELAFSEGDILLVNGPAVDEWYTSPEGKFVPGTYVEPVEPPWSLVERLRNPQDGDVYELSDEGTLTQGLSVEEGQGIMYRSGEGRWVNAFSKDEIDEAVQLVLRAKVWSDGQTNRGVEKSDDYKGFIKFWSNKILIKIGKRLLKGRAPGAVIVQFDHANNFKLESPVSLAPGDGGPAHGLSLHYHSRSEYGQPKLLFKPIATALYDYVARDVTEMSFKQGDQIDVRGKLANAQGWLEATDGRFIPENHVQYNPFNVLKVPTHSTLDSTAAHEIGHNLFLPHAPLPQTNIPGGAIGSQHDQADMHCLMGYDDSQPLRFCGKCLLRLRGWSTTLLDKDGSKNRKA